MEYNDAETIEMLNSIYGQESWYGLNTIKKRREWRYGYESIEVLSERLTKIIPIDFEHSYHVCVGILAKRLCKRCGHTWHLSSDQLPRNCPRCKSPYWRKARKN